jgi:methionyl-tRNA formyltransferase
VLRELIRSGVLDSHAVVVLEQDSIVPHRGRLAGVLHYCRKSGLRYVATQIAKQQLFTLCRGLASLRGNPASPFFPYYVNELKDFRRLTLQDLPSERTRGYIRALLPDLILSILSKERVPEEVLRIPRFGCANLHPSLLPLYRGMSPTFWCLANQETKTGVTLHYMDAQFDTGPILAQSEIPVAHKTEHSLYMLCAREGAKLLITFLRGLGKDPQPVLPTTENPREGSYYSFPSKEAVARFLGQGNGFFSLSEFFGNP